MSNAITRRQFLAGSVAASATLCGTRLTGLCKEPSAPQMAVFSKIYQDLKLNFDQSAEVTAAAGLDGIDCAVRAGGEILPEKAKDDMPRYADALARKKVRMLLLTTGIVSTASPNAQDILRTGKQLGIGHYRIGFNPHKAGTPPEKTVETLRSQLKDLAALNKDIGVCGVVQNHSPGTGKNPTSYAGGDLAEMYELVKDFNPDQVGVAFDLAHAIIVHGDQWSDHFEKLKSHIRIIYIKDVKRPRSFVPFGQGEFAKTDFFKRLKKMDYRQPYSIHVEFDWAGKGGDKTQETLAKALQESRTTLQQWLAGA